MSVADTADHKKVVGIIEQFHGGRVAAVIELANPQTWGQPPPYQQPAEPDQRDLAEQALAAGRPDLALVHGVLALVDRFDRMEINGSPLVDRTPPDTPELQAQRAAWIARHQS